MREILFRGKRVNNGEWVYGGIIPLDTDSGYVFIAEPFLSASTLPVYEIIKHHTHLVIPETVGQYTGLTDKNGKKIFEGDIVKYVLFEKISDYDDLNDAEEKTEQRNIVKFSKGKFFPLPTRYYCNDYWYGWAEDDFEVIGNIYDNPELY